MAKVLLTSEIGAVRQTCGDLPIFGDDVHDAFLDEVHSHAQGSLLNDEISGLEDLKLELGDHLRHKVLISVSEERNSSDQGSTVVVDNLLKREKVGIRFSCV